MRYYGVKDTYNDKIIVAMPCPDKVNSAPLIDYLCAMTMGGKVDEVSADEFETYLSENWEAFELEVTKANISGVHDIENPVEEEEE